MFRLRTIMIIGVFVGEEVMHETNTPFYKKRTNSIQQVIKAPLAGELDTSVARHRHVVCAELR